MFEHVTLLRNCNAITIPNGEPVNLLKDSEVVITQALGGSYTVNYHGQLVRVAGEDGDALGKSDFIQAKKNAKSESKILSITIKINMLEVNLVI